MIDSKKKLKQALLSEIGDKSLLYCLINQKYTHIFLYVLRNMEYNYNRSQKAVLILKIFYSIKFVFWHTLWKRWSLKTGITIPKNTCCEGLTLYHYGSIVLNSACRIGRNCCIMNNVNMGANGGGNKAPQIGDNVYIGPGAVLYGDIKIADGCFIGANAVVNKSFETPNCIIAGVPAKVIGSETTTWWEKNKMNRIK